MKKILSLVLAITLVIGMIGVTAFAADDPNYPRITKVSVKSVSGSRTVRVDKTLELEYRIYPEDAVEVEVKWSSSDDDVADVDSYGEVYGNAPGETVITCTVTYKTSDTKTSKKSGNITITVPGKVSSSSDDEDESSASASSKTTTTTTTATEKIAASTVTAKVKEVAKKGATTSATFKNVGSVSAATLQAAAQSAKDAGGSVTLNFDTMDGNKVEGRLTIDPSQAEKLTNDISLGVYTNEGKTKKVRDVFNKYFVNDVVVVKAAQTGSYGMTVKYAVKASAALAKSKDLRLYSYSIATGKYTEVKNAGITIDANNYARFSTNLGDYLVLSAGPIKKK